MLNIPACSIFLHVQYFSVQFKFHIFALLHYEHQYLFSIPLLISIVLPNYFQTQEWSKQRRIRVQLVRSMVARRLLSVALRSTVVQLNSIGNGFPDGWDIHVSRDFKGLQCLLVLESKLLRFPYSDISSLNCEESSVG
jgi:hypothetical protein